MPAAALLEQDFETAKRHLVFGLMTQPATFGEIVTADAVANMGHWLASQRPHLVKIGQLAADLLHRPSRTNVSCSHHEVHSLDEAKCMRQHQPLSFQRRLAIHQNPVNSAGDIRHGGDEPVYIAHRQPGHVDAARTCHVDAVLLAHGEDLL